MKLKHLLNKRRLEIFVVLFLIVVAVLYFSNGTQAQNNPPMFIPMETLNPNCGPGEVVNNKLCTVFPLGIGNPVASGDTGSIPFIDVTGKLAQDADNFFFWDADEKRLGIGTATPSARLTVDNGAITTMENTITPSSLPIAINWRNGNQQRVTLTQDSTITFYDISSQPTYDPGQTLRLIVCNGAGTSYTIDPSTGWLSPIVWAGGTAPTLTAANNKCDVLTFLATGTTPADVFGSSVLNF